MSSTTPSPFTFSEILTTSKHCTLTRSQRQKHSLVWHTINCHVFKVWSKYILSGRLSLWIRYMDNAPKYKVDYIIWREQIILLGSRRTNVTTKPQNGHSQKRWGKVPTMSWTALSHSVQHMTSFLVVTARKIMGLTSTIECRFYLIDPNNYPGGLLLPREALSFFFMRNFP